MMLKWTARLTALLAFTAIGVSSASAQTRLRLSQWLPPSHPIVTGILEPWAEQVEQVTEGRVVIDFLPALGKPQSNFDLVHQGVADVAMGVHAYTADRFPLAYGFTLPGYADNATTASVAFWRTHQKHFAENDGFDGVKLLGEWLHGPGGIFTRDREIDSADDLPGLRLRATGGVVQDISESLGIIPQFAPASEAYELITRGVVDGAFFPYESVQNFNLTDALNHSLEVPGGLYRDAHYLIMNQDIWNGFSEADRNAIEEISGEAIARLAGTAWDEADATARDLLVSKGYTINVAEGDLLEKIKSTEEQLRAAWIERVSGQGVDGAAILETFRSEIEAVAAE